MSTQPARHLFTVDEYERMGAAGLFHEDDRVELIEGEIVEMAPIGSPHAACVDRLTRLFTGVVGDRAIVRVQSPIRLGRRSEPQPDLTLLAPRDDFYAGRHPGPADVLLVVEVADTTLAWDRDVKAALYGAAGIPEAWVVDLNDGCTYTFTQPGSDGYSAVRRAESGNSLTLVGLAGVRVAVAEFGL